MFTLSITLGNDAMQTPEDVAAVLRIIATKLTRGLYNDGTSEPIRDTNGNTVGNWELTPATDD